MGATIREKGKAAMARSIENIVLSTDMAARNYEPTREEENKFGSCRINDCIVPQARKPLKFFISLFLLRASDNTIVCTAVVHVQDALNGKEVDWPRLFYNYIKMELTTLKEELHKSKTTALRTLMGPPLTMLLIDEGHLTVQHEIEAGILIIPEETEANPAKKRKFDDGSADTGETPKLRTEPQILSAMAEPIRTVLTSAETISTIDTIEL